MNGVKGILKNAGFFGSITDTLIIQADLLNPMHVVCVLLVLITDNARKEGRFP